ncbi:MAG: universal stress protein [Acidobacteriota bacterium]|nr:universal stress protein [Acidobacteriota bacterium]
MPLSLPFRRILVHVDATATAQPALDRALDLAGAAGASVTLVDVLPTPPAFSRLLVPPELRDLLRQRRADDLEALRASLAPRRVPVTAALLEGPIAVALVREVLRGGHDLLMRSHGVSPGQKRPHQFGPIDMQLLRQCPCPVWLVQPGVGRLERIVAAVDPVGVDADHEDLNDRVLTMAAALAREEQAALLVLHAWNPFAAHLLRSYMKPAEVQGYVEAAQETARTAFDELLARHAGVLQGAQPHLVRGDAGWLIPRFARAKQADLVVMGTVARTRVSGFIIGNTAERALMGLRCSVLAIKPAGFICPITTDES